MKPRAFHGQRVMVIFYSEISKLELEPMPVPVKGDIKRRISMGYFMIE